MGTNPCSGFVENRTPPLDIDLPGDHYAVVLSGLMLVVGDLPR